ncbi:MAG: hypothetical protein D6753_18095 [Planctomycetota bacterium]|nr:MAG: hypothetical protein D6753_18095 [Planctomycetota bacterium]
MPRTYHGLGLQFLYPENWRVDESEALSVTLETPEGAFLSITRLPDASHFESAMAQIRRAMEAEYEGIESEPLQKSFGAHTADGFTQRFFYLDLLVTSHVLSIARDHQAWVLHYQAEDRDMEALGRVFDAIVAQIVDPSAASPQPPEH